MLFLTITYNVWFKVCLSCSRNRVDELLPIFNSIGCVWWIGASFERRNNTGRSVRHGNVCICHCSSHTEANTMLPNSLSGLLCRWRQCSSVLQRTVNLWFPLWLQPQCIQNMPRCEGENEETAKSVFAETGIQNITHSKRHLGATIGSC